MATYFAATGIRRFFLALFAVLPSFPLSVSPCLTFLLSSVILCVLLYCGPLRLYLLQTDVPSYLFLLSLGPFSLSIYILSRYLFPCQTSSRHHPKCAPFSIIYFQCLWGSGCRLFISFRSEAYITLPYQKCVVSQHNTCNNSYRNTIPYLTSRVCLVQRAATLSVS